MVYTLIDKIDIILHNTRYCLDSGNI